jgi:hypothetical protein
MKARTSFAMGVILVFLGGVALSSAWGQSQEEPSRRRVPPTQPNQPESKPTTSQPGQPGAMDDMNNVNYMNRMMQVDSTMRRMTIQMEKSQTLSKSFGELAAAHHGADKSEILMMQRMSDSMGTIAGEIKVSLQQYKKMLGEETTSDSGKMKTEVQSFQGVLDGMASHIDEVLETLQTLQVQLGQG